jgi:hypothetical protein
LIKKNADMVGRCVRAWRHRLTRAFAFAAATPGDEPGYRVVAIRPEPCSVANMASLAGTRLAALRFPPGVRLLGMI